MMFGTASGRKKVHVLCGFSVINFHHLRENCFESYQSLNMSQMSFMAYLYINHIYPPIYHLCKHKVLIVKFETFCSCVFTSMNAWMRYSDNQINVYHLISCDWNQTVFSCRSFFYAHAVWNVSYNMHMKWNKIMKCSFLMRYFINLVHFVWCKWVFHGGEHGFSTAHWQFNHTIKLTQQLKHNGYIITIICGVCLP